MEETQGEPRARRSVRDEALRLLGRRPLTEQELQRRLAERGHPAEAVERELRHFCASGLIDDAALARDYVVARAARLGHGRRRLVEDLIRRGVAQEIALRAWQEAVDAGDVSPLAAVEKSIRRRGVERRNLDSRAYARVYNALLRAGHDEASVRRGLEPYRADLDSPDAQRASRDGMNDDFP